MDLIENRSTEAPEGAPVGRLLFEASRRAEAMGLVEADSVPPTELKAVRHIAKHVGKAGIANATAAALNNVEAPSPGEIAALLKTMIAALEASPAPKFEWVSVSRVMGAEQLMALLHLSPSSLKRYKSGE